MALQLGPELVPNGTFDSTTTGWLPQVGATLSVVAQRLRVTNGETNQGAAVMFPLETTLTPGSRYQWSVDGDPGDSGSWGYSVGDGVSEIYSEGTGIASPQTLSGEFTAVGTDFGWSLTIGSAVLAQFAEFDNVSVREILGGGGGARPKPARRWPRRVNFEGTTYVARNQAEYDRIMRRELGKRGYR